jgi:UDP-glucuronate 4-epimerase
MKKILITGAAGFIGTHLCKRFLNNGCQVVGIDYLEGNSFHPMRKFNLSFIPESPDFRFVDLNILNQALITAVIEGEQPDFLIHTAAKAGVRMSVKQPLLYTKTNILGTQYILEAIKNTSPKTKTILFSSSSVYGVQDKAPFKETMHPNPSSPYAATKYSMEQISRQYSQFYNLPQLVVRPFSIYGPLGRTDMAPFLVIKAAEQNKAFTQFGHNKDNKRDWTYINDFVSGIQAVIDKHQFNSWEVVNLGNNTPVGIDDFVEATKEKINQHLDKELKVEYGPRGKEELPLTYADISKAEKLFGYQPETSFEAGIENLIKFYKKHRKYYLEEWGIK